MTQDDAIITTKYGDGVFLQEYKGTYSLVATTEGKDGNNYLVWTFLSKWDSNRNRHVPGDRKRPMKVVLGDKDTAIEVLEKMLDVLTNGDEEEAPF